MQLPQSLIQSLGGIKGFDQKAFEDTHASGRQITSIRLNPSKNISGFPHAHLSALTVSPVPWSKYGHYLSGRPSFTFDPLFHAGTYYVQEASSMFLEQALGQKADVSASLRVLDLCAAPGGKSTHLQSLLSPESLLVANEVIRSRVNILKENIIKWGCSNVVVTNNDPKDFTKLEGYFDVIVVDAPCSGSGLFRREPEAVDEWSPDNVALCSQRQQRILADVWPSLKNGGILIYSTCSYSKEEDEQITDWIMDEFAVSTERIVTDPSWNITEVQGEKKAYGYRFWPDKLDGEGFFLACFRKTDGANEALIRMKNKPAAVNKKDQPLLEKWVRKDDYFFLQHQQTVYAWPAVFLQEYNWLLNNLRVQYSGTIVGELMRDKLVPDHSLAMSVIRHPGLPAHALDYKQAVEYLQRKDLRLDNASKGWQLVTYESHSMGWINVLPNRVNNYYPRELRILKEKPE